MVLFLSGSWLIFDISSLNLLYIVQIYSEQGFSVINSALLSCVIFERNESSSAPSLHELNLVARHKNLQERLKDRRSSVVSLLFHDGLLKYSVQGLDERVLFIDTRWWWLARLSLLCFNWFTFFRSE